MDNYRKIRSQWTFESENQLFKWWISLARPATPALVSEPGHGRGCRQSRRCPCQRSPCPEAELETHPWEGNKHGYHMDSMEKIDGNPWKVASYAYRNIWKYLRVIPLLSSTEDQNIIEVPQRWA